MRTSRQNCALIRRKIRSHPSTGVFLRSFGRAGSHKHDSGGANYGKNKARAGHLAQEIRCHALHSPVGQSLSVPYVEDTLVQGRPRLGSVYGCIEREAGTLGA